MNACAPALAVLLWLGQGSAPQPGASVSGTVTSGPNRPVAGAIVTVRADAAFPPVTTITGADGAFAIDGLRPGKHVIVVTKPGYLTAIYGATRADPAGTPIALADGEKRAGLAIDLSRGGVIAGAIRDETGAAAAYVTVNLYRAHALPRTTVERAMSTDTDDRGEFRFFGLEPNDYLVSAGMSTADAPAAGADVVDRALQALQRGERTPIEGLPAAPPQASRAALAQVFYPGTTALADATVVSVAANEDRRIDFTLRPVVLSSIRGLVSGTPPGRRPTVELGEADGLGSRLGSMATQIQTDETGRFEFTGMAPGVYRLTSRMDAPWLSAGGAAPSSFVGASIEVTVDAGAPADVVLDLQPTLTLRGIVRSTSTSKPMPHMRVGLVDAEVPDEPWRYGANPEPDHSFALANALPGRYRAAVIIDDGPAPAWHVASVTVDGHDAIDTPFEISAASVTAQRLVVTLSDVHTTLSGRLEVASGGSPSAFQIVAFATNAALWTSTRRVRAERATADGTFRFSDLPDGEYFLGVITADFADNWRAPDVLRQLAAVAVRVTVTAGESVTQNLRVR